MAGKDKLSILYLDLARHPVAADDYAGEDIRFSTMFEVLERELGCTQAVFGEVNVDWLRIREGCEHILSNQSKDLRVASWLAWALYECESVSGLAAGLGLIHYLCKERWLLFHPRKLRTRSASMQWLLLKLEKALGEDISITHQLPEFQQLLRQLDGLDEIFNLYLGSDAPLLLPLRRRLARMIQRAEQVEKEPVKVVERVKQAAVQLFSSDSDIDNERDAQRALSMQENSVRSLCRWWLKQKTTDLRAFRLGRSQVWYAVDSLPERNSEKITQLRRLPADKLSNYQERFEQGLYADLIVDLEASLAGSPFWFDGQRMVWNCLKALGGEAAMREVEVQFALLLKRIPDLVELRFHDGVPFADAETLQWIAAHILVPEVHVSNARGSESQHDALEQSSLYHDALPVLQKKGLKAAVRLVNDHLKGVEGGRERFLCKLCIARLCIDAKKYELAKVQLEHLDQELQTASLPVWEPTVFLDVSRLLYSCYERIALNEKAVARKEVIYQRLCHHDLERFIDS
ncbi:type VI secretion protein ImpA [Pseudomonas amygdali pv. tabaci str. ATCC 11528]|uniref:type VI secretion system protein TssA n=1 Tax=Pseudomonas amygdali TaxID=47877 RepID=UPI0001BC93F7|nr:type VI secretion system protein TssA [Pseudomonas amygdali]KEZ63244.1 type VI secretion protein ImpA [Pseudomonas amygdali pv. tabaci str. ATCC 11528]KKY50931.1 type VI secretion protein ImpA [Pseudomonas amygdali pv. tabaci str. ATCC 11528]QED84460.1 type VI secretion system protein TssA [Pseudomonas amygdali pv. tabaci str. ATCC 11528]